MKRKLYVPPKISRGLPRTLITKTLHNNDGLRYAQNSMNRNVIDILQERGFIDQMTSPDLRDHFAKPQKAYVGFDPTADSLHLGNLLAIVALEWMRKCGHTPYVILGGATGRIGDPSGKSVERPLLEEGVLQENVKALSKFFQHIYKGKAVVLNNDDWLCQFSLIDFLRDVGKLFRVGQMLAKESVRARLHSEEGLSFTEFSYQILQGYDFAHLGKAHGVTVQMGGSDQWGNITAGSEYNRKVGGEPLYGLTWGLLTRSDGKKFGKSEEGAIWLSEEKLSPYQFYQYLVRLPDADMPRLLRMLTFLEIDEIRSIEEAMQKSDYEPNSAQKRLAAEVTLFVHGQSGLETALKTTEGMAPGAEVRLSAALFEQMVNDVPFTEMEKSDVIGCKAADLMVKIGLVPSKSEAVRLIKNAGAYLNNERLVDPAYSLGETDLIDGVWVLLSAGKKKRFLVRVK